MITTVITAVNYLSNVERTGIYFLYYFMSAFNPLKGRDVNWLHLAIQI